MSKARKDDTDEDIAKYDGTLSVPCIAHKLCTNKFLNRMNVCCFD